MSDNSEIIDAAETPLAAVIDDSCTVEYIEIVPLDRPSDDCYKQECIDPVVEVKPEYPQDVKQEPADETDNTANMPHNADDCNTPQTTSIKPVFVLKLEDLQDVKPEPADEINSEALHHPETVRFDILFCLLNYLKFIDIRKHLLIISFCLI